MSERWRRSEELPRDVEAEIPVVVADPAPGDLRQRRLEAIGEVQLKTMTAGALLDREAHMRDAWPVAELGRPLGDNVDGRADAEPRAEADDERAVVVDQLARLAVGVVDPDRLRVDRTVPAQLARDHRADRRRVAVVEVVGALNRAERVDTDR